MLSQTQALWVMVTIGIGLLALMLFGWRKQKSKAVIQVPSIPMLPTGLNITESQWFAGDYISTVFGQDWLRRVSAHGLGNKGHARIAALSEGIVIERTGETTVFVPAAAVLRVQESNGLTGKFVGNDRAIEILWNYQEGTELTTGIYLHRKDEKTSFITKANQLYSISASATKEGNQGE